MRLPSLRFLGTLALCAIASCAVACTDDDDDGDEPPLDDPAARAPKTVDEDPSLDALDLSTTRLHVRVEGNPDGPVVIALHGGPGDDDRAARFPRSRLEVIAGADHNGITRGRADAVIPLMVDAFR